ncbi:MAG: hypothetical protein PHX51_00265 [Clostridia bacterium]|nr:hypothetical protein [Clostridia bacterium]
MIKVLGGERGTGKTQKLVTHANGFAEVATGNVVFLDRDFHRIHELAYNIRLVNIHDFGIDTDVTLLAFIKGLIAGNADIQRIYIDSIKALINKNYSEMQMLFEEFDKLSREFSVDFFLTAEVNNQNAPAFIVPLLV